MQKRSLRFNLSNIIEIGGHNCLPLDAFFPVLIAGFAVTAFPAVFIAKAIQASLALQTGDYMPFSTNLLVLLAGLAITVGIYMFSQFAFIFAIKRFTKKKSVLQYTNEI